MDKYFKILKRYRGADSLWTNNSYASTILNNDFFNVQTTQNANANLSDFNLVSSVNLTANGSAEASIESFDATIRIEDFNFEANSSVSLTEFNSSFNFNVSAIGDSSTNISDFQLTNSIEISAYSDSESSIEPFESSFEFRITASVLDLSKNEIVFIKSYMTKKVSFAFNTEKQHQCYSYLTNKNINKSKITSEINNLSLITNFVDEKSRITNNVKTNSKIV